MILKDRRDLLEELTNLVENGKTDVNCKEIIGSKFYREMQVETDLDASNFCVNPKIYLPSEVLMLATKIAAVSPNLISLSYRFNKINEQGPLLASVISRSTSIEIVDMSHNCLREHATATARAFMSGHHSKMSINFKNNNIGPPYGLEVVKVFTDVYFPLSIDLSGNELRIEPYYTGTKDVINKHNSQVAINKENMFFFYINNPHLPVETICEIMGNLNFFHIDLI